MEVRTTLSPVGFQMEDQRNWADSSYKAYSAMSYPYPNISRGLQGEETLSIEVAHANRNKPPTGIPEISVGDAMAGSRMPKISTLARPGPKGFFLQVNKSRVIPKNGVLEWGYSPAVNLFDDDTYMENLSSIESQVKTARTFAPAAKLRMLPVTLEPPYERTERDSREGSKFAEAWAAAAVKHMAVSALDEAAFDVGPGPVTELLRELNEFAGLAVLDVRGVAKTRPAVEVLAVSKDGAIHLWVINMTANKQQRVSLRIPAVRKSPPVTLDAYQVRRIKLQP